MLTTTMMTMAVDDGNPTLFMPIMTVQSHKKVKLNPSAVDKVQHMQKIELCITNTHAGHSSTSFNVASYTKSLFLVILHHDATITVKASKLTLNIANDAFPKDKEQFCCYFDVHSATKHPKHSNKTVIIGCIILSN